jgi:hypothetical protein
MWVFGYKTENHGTNAPFVAKNDGFLEILGGYTNVTGRMENSQLIRNDNSHVSAILSTNLGGDHKMPEVVETRNGQTVTARNTDFPCAAALTTMII